MARSDPQTFKTNADAGGVRLENVALQRSFETDKAGLTTIDAWIEADVVAPEGDYVTASVDLVFCLFHGDGQVGSCEARGLVFDGAGERAPIHVETQPARLGLEADVKRIEVYADRTTIIHAEDKLRFERS